jgi:hypothetical protein
MTVALLPSGSTRTCEEQKNQSFGQRDESTTAPLLRVTAYSQTGHQAAGSPRRRIESCTSCTYAVVDGDMSQIPNQQHNPPIVSDLGNVLSLRRSDFAFSRSATSLLVGDIAFSRLARPLVAENSGRGIFPHRGHSISISPCPTKTTAARPFLRQPRQIRSLSDAGTVLINSRWLTAEFFWNDRRRIDHV